MENKRQAYGLLTAVTLIIGVVIGSGIFFKTDDILKSTGGNYKLGMLVLSIGAMGIIFGSLTLSEFALRTTKSGGAVSYFEEFVSENAASGFGLFQTFIYYPTITVVVSWASAIFTLILLGLDWSLEGQILLAYGFLIFFLILNTFSRLLGGYFQNVTTLIKLIPLFFIAIAGIFYKSPPPAIPAGMEIVEPQSVGWTWLASLAPIAFSYDGWVIATSIAPEVKNPLRNMPLALVLAPAFILISYLLYFTGITKMVGETFVMTMGDKSVDYISNMLFGNIGGKILMTIATVAIMGVVNGVVMGGIRMPQALAEKDMIFKKDIANIHPIYQISLKSSLIFFIICSIWMVVHYLTQKLNILKGRDVSEIAIVFSYLTYIILYIKILKMYKDKIVTDKLRGFIAPILATVGSVIILIGGVISSPFYIISFLVFCALVFILGYVLNKTKFYHKI